MLHQLAFPCIACPKTTCPEGALAVPHSPNPCNLCMSLRKDVRHLPLTDTLSLPTAPEDLVGVPRCAFARPMHLPSYGVQGPKRKAGPVLPRQPQSETTDTCAIRLTSGRERPEGSRTSQRASHAALIWRIGLSDLSGMALARRCGNSRARRGREVLSIRCAHAQGPTRDLRARARCTSATRKPLHN